MSETAENNLPTFLVKRVYENEDFNEVGLTNLSKNQNIYFHVFFTRNLK